MLLVSDGKSYTSEQQFAPLKRHASELRRQLGVVFHFLPLRQAMRLTRDDLGPFDMVGLKLDFREPREEVERVVASFRARLADEAALIYFDGDDDLCVISRLLRHVDLYVKKHVFRESSGYRRAYIGKSNLTDYVARRHGASFADDIITCSAAVPPDETGKIFLGWNIAYDDRIARLFDRTRPPSPEAKDSDIVCRATVPARSWMYPLRHPALRALDLAGQRWSVLAPTRQVPQEQYYAELRRSRICVSPFGYGEICWRDFEAILCGCLLLKPDVSHLRTAPDIFVPGETYAPVRWDYSDLLETCQRYLDDEAARVRIATRAYDVLAQRLGPAAFVEIFRTLLDRLGASHRSLAGPTSRAPPTRLGRASP